MVRVIRTSALAALVLTLGTLPFQAPIQASHSWGGYHWARAANPFTVTLADNVSSVWDGALGTASGDWNDSDVLNTAYAIGHANPRNCKPTAGRVEVCNAAYGKTGWLGVAQIWITGGVHITQGTTKLNDTYFNTSKYNTPAWRQFVTCQEIGHTLGLDHQDEIFGNANLGTCMDYTDSPESNQHPDQHDYAELADIYEHLDSTTTTKSSPGASNADLEHPSQWGQLMKATRGGRLQTFERDLGNGQKVVTFVIWA